MNANQLLNNYIEALKMSDESEKDFNHDDRELDLKHELQLYRNTILKILKYLDYKEIGGDADSNLVAPQYQKSISEEEKNVWRTLADFKYLLDKADELDSPNE